jgi:SAM-dependent methyltransferase
MSFTINEIKGYWDKLFVPLSKKEFYEIEETHKYDNFAQFSRWNGKKVLEIGCGVGVDAIRFAQTGAKVSAVDLSETAISLAKKYAQEVGQNDIRFYTGNAEELTRIVPVEKYDLIYSLGVIHHTVNTAGVVDQIKEYCDENTIVKIMIYHKYSWAVLWILLKGGLRFWKMRELLSKYSEGRDCPITKVYSLKEANKLFKDFQIVEMKLGFPLSESNHFKIRLPFERYFGWHILITAKYKKK